MNNLMNDEKHYVTFNNYLKHRYQRKVFRISLNANFTCPNRDGLKGVGGCIYCSRDLSGDYAGDKKKSLDEQFKDVLSLEKHKWDDEDPYYIAYLQAGTNTYADLPTLRKIYEQAATLSPSVIALSIATRCDMINQEIIDLIKEIEIKYNIECWVELGLQSIHQSTLTFLNTCYTLEDFEKAMALLEQNKIKTIVHIINGLPLENKEMMLETVKYLNNFSLFGIKIHMLHILKDTSLEVYYKKNPFPLLTLEEYVEITVNQLRMLNDQVIVHRITGDGKKDDLIAPLWTLKKFVVLNEIDKYMRKKNYYQGDLCRK